MKVYPVLFNEDGSLRDIFLKKEDAEEFVSHYRPTFYWIEWEAS